MKIWYDTETFSEVPIRRGTYDVYMNGTFELSGVEVMLAQWAIDNGPVRVADLTDGGIPNELDDALRDERNTIVAHKADFDRHATRVGLGIDIPVERWHCTMAQALSHSLPGGLGLLCEVLNVKTRKQHGRELIRLFCKPRPKNAKIRRATKHTHPREWAQFLSYAGDDVLAMRDCYYAMPIRNYQGEEKAFYNLDQRMNDYGFATDTEFMDAAIALLKADKHKLDAEVTALTSGAVTAATQRDKFMVHILMEYGVILDSLRAADLEELVLSDSLPTEVKELLRLRITSAMNSTAKYTRLRSCVGADGRLRGTRQFNGASRTGRAAGRIFNPYNLRRPTMKADDIETCIALVKQGDADGIEFFADNLREACSNALRGLIIAPPGKKLVVSDWSNIEGRKAAWLTGEKWKLDAFRAFDAGTGHDLYELAYSASFGVPVGEVDDQQRQGGKVQELFLQYGGGVGAFVSGALSIGLDLDHLARIIPATAPWEVVAQARAIWAWAVEKGRTLGLSEPVYVACETVKRLYRQANANIATGWADLETAARMAITYPGEVFPACRCEFQYKANWLMVKLPSGRHLMYPNPRILADNTITYAGQVNKSWRRIKTYGGKLLENITQASSRDILVYNMLRIEREYGVERWVEKTDAYGNIIREGFNAAGVRIVLDVYDEVVCEVDEHDSFDLATLNRMLTENPPWAAGLPLAAKGFEARRYAKH